MPRRSSITVVTEGATFNVMAQRKNPYSRPRPTLRTAASQDGRIDAFAAKAVEVVDEEIPLRQASLLGAQRASEVVPHVDVPRASLDELPVHQTGLSGRIEKEVPDVGVAVQQAAGRRLVQLRVPTGRPRPAGVCRLGPLRGLRLRWDLRSFR